MTNPETSFVIPRELSSSIDDQLLEMHALYQHTIDKKEGLILPHKRDIHEEEGAVVIKGDPEAGVNVLALPFQQTWKPSMQLRSLFYHDVVNLEGVTVVLPNNSLRDQFYSLSESDNNRLNNGDLTPFYEHQARSIERILSRYKKIGKVSLDGYSQGGLTAVGIASLVSDRIDVSQVHSIEAPNEETTPRKLQKAFMKSAGSTKKAVNDAGIPSLSNIMRSDRLAKDFATFFLASIKNKGNSAIHNAMATPGYGRLVEETLRQYPEAEVTAGHIAGSSLFNPSVVEYIKNSRFRTYFIDEGEGSHKHSTGDNIVAHALMMKYRPESN